MRRQNRGVLTLCLGVGLMGLAVACGPGPGPVSPANGPDDPQAEDDSGAIAEGEAAIKAGEFEKAKALFAGIVERRPDHPKANHYLAVALEHLGDKSGAEKHYRIALEHAPSLTDAALNLSALLIDAEKFSDAAAVLEQTAGKNPKDAALQINLAYARMGMNDAAGAESAFRAALAIAETADARLGLAELQLATDKVDEAIANIDKVVQGAGDNVDALAMSAELYRKAKAPQQCIAAFDKAIALKPVAQLYSSRGVCKQMNKDMPGAKADYQKAIEVDPQFGPAHFFFGRFLLTVEKDREGAIKAFETCAQVAPDSKCAEAAEQARKNK